MPESLRPKSSLNSNSTEGDMPNLATWGHMADGPSSTAWLSITWLSTAWPPVPWLLLAICLLGASGLGSSRHMAAQDVSAHDASAQDADMQDANAQNATVQEGPSVEIGSQEARVGASVDVPVQVRDFTDVGAISLVVTYDPKVLKFAEGSRAPSLIAGAPREDFSANVVRPGELRISWFDPTVSSPISIEDGTLLRITFHQYAGGKSPVAFGENSEIGSIEAEPMGTQFQGGRVAENLED